MNITLTDEQIGKMGLETIRELLDEACARRDKLLERRGELDGWLGEAYDHVHRLSMAAYRIRQATEKRDWDGLIQRGSRGAAGSRSPEEGSVEMGQADFSFCLTCKTGWSPGAGNRCPTCGTELAVKSSGGG